MISIKIDLMQNNIQSSKMEAKRQNHNRLQERLK